jgi:hypothetical protein
MAVISTISSTKLRRTTGTADTLIEVGRFLLEARAASRRAAEAVRNPTPSPADPRPDEETTA